KGEQSRTSAGVAEQCQVLAVGDHQICTEVGPAVAVDIANLAKPKDAIRQVDHRPGAERAIAISAALSAEDADRSRAGIPHGYIERPVAVEVPDDRVPRRRP